MKILKLLTFAAFLGIVCAMVPGLARAQNTPLGLVAKAVNAHIGGSAATEGTTVYSGDVLSTDDSGVLLIRVGGLALELQNNSTAHIYKAPYGAVAELNHGSIVYTTPGGHENVVIVASDVRVTPVLNLADFGRVSIEDECNVSVQSQKGQADVRSGSESHLVEQGKAYRVRAENSVSYTKYLSPEADDYHKYHGHKPCAAEYQTVKGHTPIVGGQSHFLLVVGAAATVATIIPIIYAFESDNKPKP